MFVLLQSAIKLTGIHSTDLFVQISMLIYIEIETSANCCFVIAQKRLMIALHSARDYTFLTYADIHIWTKDYSLT